MRRPFTGNWTLTQGFGENPASYARFGMRGHNGLDYGTPTGTPILAPHSGKVLETSNDPTGYGLYIKIENDKEGSVLAHLKSFNVIVGQNVTEGQAIGLSDNTGNSTGPHLHWGYYTLPRNRANGFAGFVDQAPLLPPRGETPSEGGVDMNDREKKDLYWKWSQSLAERIGVTWDANNPQKSVDEALAKVEQIKKDSADHWSKYVAESELLRQERAKVNAAKDPITEKIRTDFKNWLLK